MQKHFYLHFCILCKSLKVCIVKCILSGGKPESLKTIIKHNDLPLNVQFAGSGDQSMVNIGGSEQTSSLFTVTLLHTYEDIYLLANAICDGRFFCYD
jgi:hypothetical protein